MEEETCRKWDGKGLQDEGWKGNIGARTMELWLVWRFMPEERG